MQKVLITAGASGIGREMVHAFCAAGAKVGVIDIDASLLATLRVSHPAVITETCDLGDRTQIEATVAVDADIGDDAVVGPFAALGPGAAIPSGTRTGPHYAAP